MTKEELIEKCFHICANKKILSDAEYLASTMRKFFESNVCIPKGENRHPYADELHEWSEDISKDLQYYNHDSSIRGYLSVPNFYQYRFKQPEPIYEWQWLHMSKQTNTARGFSFDYFTDDEVDEEVYRWVKIEETKRERK